MIIGVGTDIVSVARIASAMAEHEGFLVRILTPAERSYCGQDAKKVAARWAAKEALYKALGGGLSWQDAEISHAESGSPVISWRDQGSHAAHLSLSHENDFAVAFVVVERPQS